ncbi:hypothetical protein MAE02_48450 [Microvirga aerophila]|uniref:Uncharacterized protein n=1 Tax=Microvirga aerophila TaxID=670291 RepID=A0A512BYW9_9HYPH|nr:hypothetical protein MAE02_48450 [Microvirga aerophila]
MSSCQGIDIMGVASPYDGHHGDPALAGLFDDVAVALAQALIGERETTQPILSVGINAGIQEYQVGLKRIEKARQVRLQNVKVRAVLHAVRQAKVEITRNLAHGIILFGMHGKGEKIRIIG